MGRVRNMRNKAASQVFAGDVLYVPSLVAQIVQDNDIPESEVAERTWVAVLNTETRGSAVGITFLFDEEDGELAEITVEPGHILAVRY